MPQTLRALGRRLRQTFGISAPRMAVRTRLSWRWRAFALLGGLALIAGMWWWGFDFGQFLGGFNRSAVAEKQARLEADAAVLKDENIRLRARLAELESDSGPSGSAPGHGCGPASSPGPVASVDPGRPPDSATGRHS